MCDTTISRWVIRHTRFAASELSRASVNVGATWIADNGDCMDDKTQFILASYELASKSVRGTRILLGRAEKLAGKRPEVVIADGLLGNLEQVCGTAGVSVCHSTISTTRDLRQANELERLHLAVRGRFAVSGRIVTKPMKRIVTEGWMVHHNFFRPNEYLEGRTPAEAAGAQSPFKSWEDVVKAEVEAR